MTSFSKWDRDAYRARVGEEEAARRRGAIMAARSKFKCHNCNEKKSESRS